MSFGFSTGDIVLCVHLAHKVWREARDAANDFRNISTEVASFKLVLEEVQVSISERQIDKSKEKELRELLHGCENVLTDLQQLLVRYRSLGTQSRRTWDRMRFGQAPVEKIRSRLISHTSLLTSFRSGLHGGSLFRIERLLEQLTLEYRSGLRESSVISNSTIESAEQGDELVWSQISKELEDVGITPNMVVEYQDYIISWIKEALLDGEFVESDLGLNSAVELQPSDPGRTPNSVLRVKSLKLDAHHKLLPSPHHTDSPGKHYPMRDTMQFEVNSLLTDLCIRRCEACSHRTRYTTFEEALNHLCQFHPGVRQTDNWNQTFGSLMSDPNTGTNLNDVKADYISVVYGGVPLMDNPNLKNSDYNRTGATQSEQYDLGAFPTELLPFINNSIIREEDIEQYHELSITRARNIASPFLDFPYHQIKNIHSGKYLGLDQNSDGDINQSKATCTDEKAASSWKVVNGTEISYQIFASLPGIEVPLGICYREFARPEIRLASLVPEQKPLAFQWTLECLGQASSLFKVRPISHLGLALDVDVNGELWLQKEKDCASQLWAFLPS